MPFEEDRWGEESRLSGAVWRVASNLVLALSLLAAGCGPVANPVSPREVQTSPAASVVTEVHAETVRLGSISVRIFAPASLVARRASQIGAEVPGRIQEIFVRDGDRVARGAPLFRIDPLPYEAAHRMARAGLDLARSEREQIAADLHRLSALREDGIGSQSDLDRATTALKVARARERQAEEVLAIAALDLKRTLVVAPYAGSIFQRLADEGTTALAQPQTIVLVLHESSELEAHADVGERQLSDVRVGDRAWVHVDGLAEPIETRVDAVADTIDPATRTYHVRMRIPNPEHRLKDGIYARVEIEPSPRNDVLIIPREAIRSEAAHAQVLVAKEGVAVAMPVRLGLVSATDAEVIEGLEVGLSVIVGNAAQELAPGMQVRVLPKGRGKAS